jgi:tRNA U34 5-methylaminomethyl-2-thiouridine-forming methyltransferase MnmC
MAPDFEIVQFPNGSYSVRDSRVDQSMHSMIGPWEEAIQIYIQQSDLKRRLESSHTQAFVIYDIGLGIAANALAALHCFFSSTPLRGIHLVSFENDLRGLEIAFHNRDKFSFLKQYEFWVETLLRDRQVSGHHPNGVSWLWELYEGDFRERIEKLRTSPDLIFYDLFSPSTCAELWGYKNFSQIFKVTEPKRKQGLSTQLITYSSATHARTALLLSGFYVGQGVSTPMKKDTTFASTRLEDLSHPLGEEWATHWQRSTNKFPLDYDTHDSTVVSKKILHLLDAQKNRHQNTTK